MYKSLITENSSDDVIERAIEKNLEDLDPVNSAIVTKMNELKKDANEAELKKFKILHGVELLDLETKLKALGFDSQECIKLAAEECLKKKGAE